MTARLARPPGSTFISSLHRSPPTPKPTRLKRALPTWPSGTISKSIYCGASPRLKTFVEMKGLMDDIHLQGCMIGRGGIVDLAAPAAEVTWAMGSLRVPSGGAASRPYITGLVRSSQCSSSCTIKLLSSSLAYILFRHSFVLSHSLPALIAVISSVLSRKPVTVIPNVP